MEIDARQLREFGRSTIVASPGESRMASRPILISLMLLCFATPACSKRPKSFADSMRERYANDEFTISLRAPLPDGRPVIAIDWASKHQYAKEPLRGYRLLVRRNGTPYYMRTFASDEFGPQFAMDLAMSRAEFKPNDTLSVRVEVNLDEYAENSILLSNSLAIDLPPESAADLSVPPRPKRLNSWNKPIDRSGGLATS